MGPPKKTRRVFLVLLVMTTFLGMNDPAFGHPDETPIEDEPEACGGAAPAAFWCTLDGHSVNLQWGTDYTGILESVVAHDAGERRFWCTVDGGSLMWCEADGNYPPVGSPITVECWSLWERSGGIPWLKTGIDGTPQTTPGGIPGGMGDWSCMSGE